MVDPCGCPRAFGSVVPHVGGKEIGFIEVSKVDRDVTCVLMMSTDGVLSAINLAMHDVHIAP